MFFNSIVLALWLIPSESQQIIIYFVTQILCAPVNIKISWDIKKLFFPNIRTISSKYYVYWSQQKKFTLLVRPVYFFMYFNFFSSLSDLQLKLPRTLYSVFRLGISLYSISIVLCSEAYWIPSVLQGKTSEVYNRLPYAIGECSRFFPLRQISNLLWRN